MGKFRHSYNIFGYILENVWHEEAPIFGRGFADLTAGVALAPVGKTLQFIIIYYNFVKL